MAFTDGLTPIEFTADYLDSRDVIARIDYLQSRKDDEDQDDPLDEDEAEELRALQEMAEEGERYAADWPHGETLIADSYFESYAKELAADIYGYKDDGDWPTSHIDWEAAAAELQQDYAEIEVTAFGNKHSFWVR